MIETFILQEYLQDLSICDELIKFYNLSNNKEDGTAGGMLNNNIKKCTEIYISTDDFIKANPLYIDNLMKICNLYVNKYKYCNHGSSWGIVENIKIQHYKQNEGYFGWHSERNSAQFPYSSRHLVFMTYLNDVKHDGETEFYYQKLKIKPEKGKTLIWPADWTHTHRGVTSPTQEKYIITGWFNFLN